MSRKEYDYEIVRISKASKAILDELYKESECSSRKEYTEKMIQYFKDNGLDPATKGRSVGDEIAKLRNTVISFIREQEKKKLEPMIQQVSEITSFLADYYKNEAVTKKDLQRFISDVKGQEVKPERVKEEARAPIHDNRIEIAKDYFRDFITHLKSSSFSSSSLNIDKTIVNKYSELFAKL